jgi:hypothetical protein
MTYVTLRYKVGPVGDGAGHDLAEAAVGVVGVPADEGERLGGLGQNADTAS